MDRIFNINKSAKEDNSPSMDAGLISLDEVMMEDRESLLILFVALERLLEMKGKRMSDVLWKEKMRIQSSLGKDGLFRARNRENLRELDMALDMLEVVDNGIAKREMMTEGEFMPQDEMEKNNSSKSEEHVLNSEISQKEILSEKVMPEVKSPPKNVEMDVPLENSDIKKDDISESAEKTDMIEDEIEGGDKLLQEVPPPALSKETPIDLTEVDNPVLSPEQSDLENTLEAEKTDTENNVKICQSCGKGNVLDAIFCEHCGYKLVDSAEQEIDIEPKDVSVESQAEELSFEEQLKAVKNNKESLLAFLDSIEGIEDAGNFISAIDLKKSVELALDKLSDVKISEKKKIEMAISEITEAGGLREKLHRIFVHGAMKKESVEIPKRDEYI